MSRYKIAVIEGDGIGREVVPEGLGVLEAVGRRYQITFDWHHFDWSCQTYLNTGQMMPEDGLDQLRGFDAIYLGAVGYPGVPDHVSLWGLLIPIRRALQQYVNLRPVRLLRGIESPVKGYPPGQIDFCIVRENNEGEYSEAGGRLYRGTEAELAVQETVFTRRGCDRIMRYAFDLARKRKGHVTSATKSNGIIHTMPFWDERFSAMAKHFPCLLYTSTQKAGKSVSHEKVPLKVRPFPLKQVRLGDGPCKVAMEADRRYLRSLPPDRLLHTFRINAAIPSSAEPLGGWEKPDCELRGHYAGGHYLSACALMYASVGDEDLKNNANTVVGELGKCQNALKSGYLSAFPIEFFDRLRERQRVWAPFYTIHKIMAGLLDMYTYCGNEQALDMVQKMAGWTAGYTGPLSYEHMQRVLGTEYGGMGEVLSNLYAVTGKSYYLDVAQRFDKKQFFDPLAAHRDELKGLHVNTHIPQVTAAARLYELTGERRYRDIAEYFWDEVVSERSYCTGGTSNGESWNTDPGKLSTELSTNTTECCCAYNMMKLTRHVFGWSPHAHLMDYYERTLFNHRLGTINPEDGTMMYYLPRVSYTHLDVYKRQLRCCGRECCGDTA